MLLSNRSYWTGRHLPVLSPETESGATATSESKPAETETAVKDDLDQNKDLGDAGKEVIRKERAAAKAAADRARAAEEERDALKAEKTEREAAATKAQEAEAAKKGEFEALATKREQERDAAKNEATSLKAENDQLRAAMKTGVETQWKALPPALQLAGKVLAEDDVLGRWNFLHDADVQKEITESTKDPALGNGRDPKSSGAGTRSVEDEARLINRTGNYAM